MKVLFLSQIVHPPHGGVLQRGYNILRELGRKADIHLIAFVHPDELRTKEALEESRRALEQFCEVVEYFPLWVKASPFHQFAALAASAFSTRPFSSIAYRSAAFQRCVSDALRSIPFDVVHVDTIALHQFVPTGRALPAVLTHHNIESVLMERRGRLETRPLARQFLLRDSAKLRALECQVTPQYDVNIVVSPKDEEVLRERVPGVRTAVVPNGVDIEYFTPDWECDTPALIYTGGMNMFANRDAVSYFVNETWPRICSQVPEVRFFAVGQDPPSELLGIAARDPRVTVTGYVDDIRPFVRQSAVYVVPLRVGGGTRLKVLDAMAMGKALVSTTIGCEGIELTAGEHVVIADTPQEFADATVMLLQDRARRLALGRAARALVERRYAWSIVGGRLLAAYGEAIASKKDVGAPLVPAGLAR